MATLQTRILIVEADDALAGVMSELLCRVGYDCRVVKAVGEAVGRLCLEAVQAVIFDLDTVPLRQGDGAVTMMRTWLRAWAVPPPFILLSVYDPLGSGNQGQKNLPFDSNPHIEWMRKPFRNEEFLAMIRKMTARGGLVGGEVGDRQDRRQG